MTHQSTTALRKVDAAHRASLSESDFQVRFRFFCSRIQHKLADEKRNSGWLRRSVAHGLAEHEEVRDMFIAGNTSDSVVRMILDNDMSEDSFAPPIDDKE